LEVIRQNPTHVWANTILFAQHPLQTSTRLDTVAHDLRVVGQPPKLVELYDDKNFVNEMLRAKPGFTLPAARLVGDEASLQDTLSSLSASLYPVVGKPVRGRGSHGVQVCRNKAELEAHARDLLSQNTSVIIEDYLAGQEATVTVMPPSQERPEYWALPVVERFNHDDGIAPYNGVVAVTQNSRVITEQQSDEDPSYVVIQKQCVDVAKLLCATAPIRVDVRRFTSEKTSPFALFDVNMKPVSKS
jgi:D-alanine-D-alanine ligase-like ATP-grasp enzyme